MKIDTNKKPTLLDLEIVEHREMGTIEWNPKNVKLHLEPKQKQGFMVGKELYERLKNKPVLNATVLEYLFENQELIPESWKGKYVYFWGTIYRGSSGSLCVRYLYFCGGQWNWLYDWLGADWCSNDPAAVLVSISPLSFDPLKLEIKYGEKVYKLVEK